MQWISVDERLPEDDREVVIWTEGEDFKVGRYHNLADVSGASNCWAADDRLYDLDEVTHWMDITPPHSPDESKPNPFPDLPGEPREEATGIRVGDIVEVGGERMIQRQRQFCIADKGAVEAIRRHHNGKFEYFGFWVNGVIWSRSNLRKCEAPDEARKEPE
jgi:hypothetical protein